MTHFFSFIISLFFLFASYSAWTEEAPTNETSAKTEQQETTNDEAAQTKTEKTADSGKKSNKSSLHTKIKDPVNVFKQTKADIKHYLPNEEFEALLAGPDDYLISIEENHTAINKGVVILLPDWAIGMTTPKSINYLRKAFPESGWTTITIQPSFNPENYPSQALEEKKRLEENSQALKNYQMKLNQLMPAIMEKAKAYPGIFLVVAEGNHAAMLTNLYHENDEIIPSALILLSAYLPTLPEAETFAQNMADLEIPVLDLYLKHDHPQVRENALARKKHAEKEMKVYYRQSQLTNFSSSYFPNETLYKSIQGWLRAVGW